MCGLGFGVGIGGGIGVSALKGQSIYLLASSARARRRPTRHHTSTQPNRQQVRKLFDAVIPKKNLVKRLLAGMALIIDHKYSFCVHCGRHDAPEVRNCCAAALVVVIGPVISSYAHTCHIPTLQPRNTGAGGLWGGGGVGPPHGLPRAYVRVSSCVRSTSRPSQMLTDSHSSHLNTRMHTYNPEMCGFIFTTQTQVFHAAEETIRNGQYVPASLVVPHVHIACRKPMPGQ